MPEPDYRVPDWIIEFDCEIEGPWLSEGNLEATTRIAATALLNVAPEFDNSRLVVSALFTTDGRIQELNRRWRGQDKPTNVLSFPMLTREELLALTPEGAPVLFGDIALAYETCAREAEAEHISLWDHTVHLIVHGLLHLAGHDHETSSAEAAAMEALEVKALETIGIADPYSGGN